MGKRGISAVVATVLIVLVSISLIIVLWSGLTNVVYLDFLHLNSRLSVITEEDYTFYDSVDQSVTLQVESIGDDAPKYAQIILIMDNGEELVSVHDAPPINNLKRYYLDVSSYSASPDSVVVAPIFAIEGKNVLGQKTSPVKLSRRTEVASFYDYAGLPLVPIFDHTHSHSAGEFTTGGVIHDCFNLSNDVVPICTCVDLQRINEDLTKDYELLNDIDCSDTHNWNDGKGFMPIGIGSALQSSCSGGPGFGGNFNGGNYNIYNLFIGNYSDRNCLGLFGYSFGYIHDVGVVDVTIIASPNSKLMAGGLVASNRGTISRSYSIYDIQGYARGGSAFLGGLAGENYGNITNSYSRGNLIGGSYASAYSSYIGGLVGITFVGNISNCYSVSNINLSSGSYLFVGGVGGLVGKVYPRTGVYKYIDHSFAVGNLNLNYSNSAGGLVGFSDINLLITSGYWSNSSYNPPIACYTYNSLPGNNNCVSIQDDNSYFYDSTNAPMSSWDFTSVWTDVEGNYPVLQ